jgi:hypothetical protein
VKDKNTAVAKGIPTSVQNSIEHKDYKTAVFGEKVENC